MITLAWRKNEEKKKRKKAGQKERVFLVEIMNKNLILIDSDPLSLSFIIKMFILAFGSYGADL